jgi:hypothetical protein
MGTETRADARPGGAWYTSVAPGAFRLFRSRHYRSVAITDGRVVVAARRGDVLLDLATSELELTGVRNRLLLQVLVTDASSRTHVFEFRPRRHAAGRAFADALR